MTSATTTTIDNNNDNDIGNHNDNDIGYNNDIATYCACVYAYLTCACVCELACVVLAR